MKKTVIPLLWIICIFFASFMLGRTVKTFTDDINNKANTIQEQDCTIEKLQDSLNIIQLKLDSLEYEYVEEKSEVIYFWNTLAKIESSEGTYTIGDNGKSKGPLQIQIGALKDVNKKYRLNYSHDDMYDFDKSMKVGSLYLNMLIERHCRIYNTLPTKPQIARMWNGGFGLYNDSATLSYSNKFINYYKNT